MPALRRALHPLDGPLLVVTLTPDPLRAEMLRQAGRPVPQQVQGLALIDTGAKQSCVHAQTGKAIFKQVGKAQITTPAAAEPIESDVFYGAFKVRGTALAEREQEFLGSELGYTINGERVLLLLGRDFLSELQMIYDGRDGHFELRW